MQVIKNSDGQIQARINDRMYVVIGMAFGVIGIVAVAVYIFGEHGSHILAAMALIGLTTAGSLLTTILK